MAGCVCKAGPEEKVFWCVTKATKQSQLIDVVFRASLRDLEMQFKGGLKAVGDNLTVFASKAKAVAEGYKRLREAGSWWAMQHEEVR